MNFAQNYMLAWTKKDPVNILQVWWVYVETTKQRKRFIWGKIKRYSQIYSYALNFFIESVRGWEEKEPSNVMMPDKVSLGATKKSSFLFAFETVTIDSQKFGREKWRNCRKYQVRTKSSRYFLSYEAEQFFLEREGFLPQNFEMYKLKYPWICCYCVILCS